MEVDNFKTLLKTTKEQLNSIRQSLLRQNQSYQEYQYSMLQQHPFILIENLLKLHQQKPIITDILNRTIKNLQRYPNTILLFTAQIKQILDNSQMIDIIHQHNYSQSVLLGVYLQHSLIEQPITIISYEQINPTWLHIIDEKQCDKSTALKSLLWKQKIKIITLEDSLRKKTPLSGIIIIDLFNINPINYRTELLSINQKLRKCHSIIWYHSHLQKLQITSFLEDLKYTSEDYFEVEASSEYPLQLIVQPKNTSLKQELISFLKENVNHPDKQDAIIFYLYNSPSNYNLKKYLSKFTDLLKKNEIQNHVNIISKSNQIINKNKCNIFIAIDATQLQKWNYNYSNVFYIIDYGMKIRYQFEYNLGFYTENLMKCNTLEKLRRISYAGIHKIGRYCYKQEQILTNKSYLSEVSDISAYVLKMIQFQQGQYLQWNQPKVYQCLQFLQKLHIVKKIQKKIYKIISDKLVDYIYKSVNPLYAQLISKVSLIQTDKQIKTMSNLVIMSAALLNSSGSIRSYAKQFQPKINSKPTGIWRKTGFLDSSLDILTKCQLIQNKANCVKSQQEQSIRKKTSVMNENQFQIYGSLFEIVKPKKIAFQEMQYADLVRQYLINEDSFEKVRDQIDRLREIFEINQTNIFIRPQNITKVLEYLLEVYPFSIAIYSGSKRIGYCMQNSKDKLFPHKNSLIAQLNETPQFIYIMRTMGDQNHNQIIMCNHLSQDLYLQHFNGLPHKKTQSLSQAEIQFHGISSATFQGLWKYNGAQITNFQQQYKCVVQPNQQMGLIIVYCPHQEKNSVKLQFEGKIKKIRDKLANSNKIVHYLGQTSLLMFCGGVIQEVLKKNFINKCIITNLDVSVDKQDLQQLFEQFFNLKNIQVQPEKKYKKQAIIQFNSQKDYYRFHQYYHECMYLDRMIEVKPLSDELKTQLAPEQYIQFKWYVWKSHRKALIEYVDVSCAEKAYQNLANNPIFDNAKIKVQLDNQKRIILENLKEVTDQIFLQKGLLGYGELKEVSILRSPIKQSSCEDQMIRYQIKQSIGIDAKFTMQNIKKKKNGLRICRVNIDDFNLINKLCTDMNEKTGFIGQGRLYTQQWYTIPTIVPNGSLSIYQELLDQTIQQMPQKPNIVVSLQQLSNNKVYLVLKSSIKKTVDYISENFMSKLTGYVIQLSEFQKEIILCDVGLTNLYDLEKKYNCKLVANLMQKTLKVLIKYDRLKKIKQQIKARVEDSFFYRLGLNAKTYKHFKENPNKLVAAKNNYQLTFMDLDPVSKCLILEGSARKVQIAFNFLMHLMESLSIPQEQMVNADVCMICCNQPFRPYRLQSCGHRFCMQCLVDTINNTLGDISMFPIRCPHCNKEMVVDDLDSLVEPDMWIKLINMAANQFVGKHQDTTTFCFTAGCKQINLINKNYFSCDVCKISYCCQCKLRYHQGLTCKEAKEGGDQLFMKYMKQNGVRRCPNKQCTMPIVRLQGCYRVTCSRCGKSMCFKCQPEKMIPYDNYTLCYKHLSDVHGGYF